MPDPPLLTPSHRRKLAHLADPDGAIGLSGEARAAVAAALAELDRLRTDREALLHGCRVARKDLTQELADCASPGSRRFLEGRIAHLDGTIAFAEGRTGRS